MLLNFATITESMLLLLLAAFLGSIIGYEREKHNRPAGLRTHALVCLGSAIITLVGIYGFSKYGSTNTDPSRLASQIVSGIGFLGAGTILREGLSIKGLTTAATLWATAGIGIAVGTNMPVLAICGTVLITVILIFLGKLERRANIRSGFLVKLSVVDRPGVLAEAVNFVSKNGANILSSETFVDKSTGIVHIEFNAIKYKNSNQVLVIEDLLKIEGIVKAEVINL